MVRPNRSAAGNKLNLFLCFASSFLPFLLQIAKKTFLRRRWGWEVGKKWEMDGIQQCRDVFVSCILWDLCERAVLDAVSANSALGMLFSLLWRLFLSPMTATTLLYGWRDCLTSLGVRWGTRNLCLVQLCLFFLLSFLQHSAGTRTGISIFTPVSSNSVQSRSRRHCGMQTASCVTGMLPEVKLLGI